MAFIQIVELTTDGCEAVRKVDDPGRRPPKGNAPLAAKSSPVTAPGADLSLNGS